LRLYAHACDGFQPSGDLGVGRCRRYRVRAQWCAAYLMRSVAPAEREEDAANQGDAPRLFHSIEQRTGAPPRHPPNRVHACRGVLGLCGRPRARTTFRIAAVARARAGRRSQRQTATPMPRKLATDIGREVQQSASLTPARLLQRHEPAALVAVAAPPPMCASTRITFLWTAITAQRTCRPPASGEKQASLVRAYFPYRANSRRKSAARFGRAQASRRRAFYGAMSPQRSSQSQPRPMC